MEVACSKCGAKGRVPDARIASGPLSVRCSACGSVLKLGSPKVSANGPAWFFDAGQGAQGPYRIDELVALWHAGRLGWDARLWREGDPEWAAARAHGPFIDAIFARDANTLARADAHAAARRDANLPAAEPRERADARFVAIAIEDSATARARDDDRTDPQLSPPQHVPAGAAELAAGVVGTAPAPRGGAAPRTPDARARDRAAHDSLAPSERASRVPGRRWPVAIVLGSSALAAGVLFWAVRAEPAPAVTRSATTVDAPRALPATPQSALAREHADVAAAMPAATPVVDPIAPAETAVAEPPAVPTAPAQPGVLPAAQARPLRSAAERPRSAVSGVPASASTNAGEEREGDDSALADDHAGNADAPDDEPPAATPAARGPDFLGSAAPLPDTPTTLQIAGAMRAVAPAVRACADGSAPSTIYVSVAIAGATGRPSQVHVPGVASSIERCVANAVQNAAFPRFERAQLELRFPFLIGQ